MSLRVATFNLENLDDGPKIKPSLQERINIMRPQLIRINADILLLQEVCSQMIDGKKNLAALDRIIEGTKYQDYYRTYSLTTEGEYYDDRNLVIISKYKLLNVKVLRDSQGLRPSYKMQTAIPPQSVASPLEWERPILYANIITEDNVKIHIFNIHLKSKLPTSVPGQKIDQYTWSSISACAEGGFVSSMKRFGQAVQVRTEIDNIFNEYGNDSCIIVGGDFNSDISEFALQAICGSVEETGNPKHATQILIPCENNIPEVSRYSLFHLGKGQMLDHVIASRSLLAYFNHTEIHNEALPDESGAFRDDTKFPESDHAPVIAEFSIK